MRTGRYLVPARPSEVTVEQLIGGVLVIYQGRLVNSNVVVEMRHRTTRAVLCFEGEIRQVISNLIANAIDAMHPGGGRMMLRSREAINYQTGERGLVITVADTGGGMSPQTAKHIFEPFFTTKGFRGTGLGLWISKEIVSRHNGTLKLRSSQREGKIGTVFVLFLPFEAWPRKGSESFAS